MAFGRPTKYNQEMCLVVVEKMNEGWSKHEVCRELGICFETMKRWEREHPDFLEAVKTGTSLSQGWWEGQGRQGLANKEFNPALWFMNMKNRFHRDWKDKRDLEMSSNPDKPMEWKVEIVRPKDVPGDDSA